jgi:hypothetical protein
LTPVQLLALYLAVGGGVAWMVARRTTRTRGVRFAAACAAWALWPHRAPVALAGDRPSRTHARSPLARVHAALEGATAAAAGSPFEPLIGEASAERIRRDVDRVASRIDELTSAIARPGSDPAAAARRVEELERAGASGRAIAAARVHRDAALRLAEARDADLRALGDLADALEALRGQVVLAKMGSPGERAGDIVADVWARVEGLGAAMEEEVHVPPPAFARDLEEPRE